MENLSNDHGHHPNQHKNSQKLCNEKGHPFLSLKKVNGNRDSNMIGISQRRGSHCKKILAKEEIYKSKRAGIRVTHRDQSRIVNHLSKFI